MKQGKRVIQLELSCCGNINWISKYMETLMPQWFYKVSKQITIQIKS